MEWEDGRESDNVVQDDGGSSNVGGVGGGARFPLGNFHLGIGGILIIVVVSLLFGINPLTVLGALSGISSGSDVQSSQPLSSGPTQPVASNDPQIKFVRVILGSTEDVWGAYFQQIGRRYEQPKLELFNGHTRSACGAASEAMGPFYCAGDGRVYLDLQFFHDMETQFHATGDFARAYVIAHEVGHHVQDLLGTMEKVAHAESEGTKMQGANGLSVRLELQADCYAGVWANKSQAQLHWLQDGDVQAAINTAQQIGDDRLETRSQGYAVPDSFTHGTSDQRVRWFNAGFSSGDIAQCDTFNNQL